MATRTDAFQTTWDDQELLRDEIDINNKKVFFCPFAVKKFARHTKPRGRFGLVTVISSKDSERLFCREGTLYETVKSRCGIVSVSDTFGTGISTNVNDRFHSDTF